MKPKTLVMMVVAVACGFVVVYSMNTMGGQQEQKKEMVDVLVATIDIRPGVPLDETNTVFKQYEKPNVPEGAITTKEQYEERASRVPLFAQQAVLTKMLGEKGAIGASVEIPPGMGVVSVAVDSTTSHSGMLMPGDLVDLMVTWKANTDNGPIQRSKIFLKKVKVFAAGNVRDASTAADTGEIKAKNVSLLVTSRQAQMVKLSESTGKLHLIMRPPGEDVADEDDDGEGELSDDFLSDDASLADSFEDDNSGALAALDAEMKDRTTEDAPQETEPEPVVPTWTINIYEGDKLRVEHVELPLEESPAAAALRVTEPAPATSEETATAVLDAKDLSTLVGENLESPELEQFTEDLPEADAEDLEALDRIKGLLSNPAFGTN